MIRKLRVPAGQAKTAAQRRPAQRLSQTNPYAGITRTGSYGRRLSALSAWLSQAPVIYAVGNLSMAKHGADVKHDLSSLRRYPSAPRWLPVAATAARTE